LYFNGEDAEVVEDEYSDEEGYSCDHPTQPGVVNQDSG
jgi:hypothetical protein